MLRSHKKLVMCLALSVLGVGCLPSKTHAQSVVEAKLALRDIRHWLPGTYNNESQFYVERAFGTGEDGSHPWWQIEIEAIENTRLGDDVFIARRADHEQLGKSYDRVQLLAFKVDESMRAVRMTTYGLSADTLMDSSNGEEIASAAVIVDDSCPIYWRQGPEHVYGAMRGSWCEANSSAGPILLRSDLHLTDSEFWVFTAKRDTKTGEAINGRSDEVPLRFKKVKWYECFIFIMHQQDPGKMTLIDPFTLHDGGGRFFFETEEATPRKMEVFLRRGLWPSASGNNLSHTVQLFLYEDGNREKELTSGAELVTAWSPADSGKVGWRQPGLGGSQCKLPTPPPFE